MQQAPCFYIHTFGCKVNRAESEAIAAALMSAGWKIDTPENCDVAIVNTCTVTGEADMKNRKHIRTLLRAGCPAVIVTGCSANIDSKRYADIDNCVRCETDKSAIPALAMQLLAEGKHGETRNGVLDAFGILASTENAAAPRTPSPSNEEAPQDIETLLRTYRREGESFRTRVDVKIQDGCNNACTYCIVHTARGKAKSTPASLVAEEVERIAASGTREVVLVGIDLAAYNSEGRDLAGLLGLLLGETQVGRIRLSSIEPQSLNDALVERLASADGRVCRHLHVCLQSGSTKVLEEMNRHYSAKEFCEAIAHIRRAVPEIALSTDVIVGFPGETDEDFAETCRVIEECGFMRLHVFRYSKRPGTPAAAREDQVDPKVIAQRAASLRKLGEKLAHKDMERRLGKLEQVIVERTGVGTSESYHKVVFDEDLPIGSLVTMQVDAITKDGSALAAHAV